MSGQTDRDILVNLLHRFGLLGRTLVGPKLILVRADRQDHKTGAPVGYEFRFDSEGNFTGIGI